MSEKIQTSDQTTDRSPAVNKVSAATVGEDSLNQSAANKVTTMVPGHSDDYIQQWRRSLTILHRGHWDAARFYEKVNLGLGLATAIAAAISGTTAFTQIQNQAEQGGLNIWLQVGVGIFALAAAALGATQAFVRPSELAARHKQAAQKFGKLRREIELHLNLGLPTGHDKREQLLTDFRTRWDAVDEESLPLPKRIYDNVEAEYESKSSIVK
jgi:hypothetical protein